MSVGVPQQNLIIANTMILALERWANRTKYRALFEVLPVEIRRIFFEAFCEMESLKPGIYDLWWVVNHNRYIRDFKQRDLILVHEIMYFFLSNYCDGTLKKMAQANAI
jgi:hypothetical protein